MNENIESVRSIIFGSVTPSIVVFLVRFIPKVSLDDLQLPSRKGITHVRAWELSQML